MNDRAASEARYALNILRSVVTLCWGGDLQDREIRDWALATIDRVPVDVLIVPPIHSQEMADIVADADLPMAAQPSLLPVEAEQAAMSLQTEDN